MQAKIQKKCCPSGRLSILALMCELDLLNKQARSQKAVAMELMKAKQSTLTQSTPVLEFLQQHINPYALKLVYEQAREAGKYLSNPLDDGARSVYRRGQAGAEVLPSRQLNLVFDAFGNCDWRSTKGDEDFGLDEVGTARKTEKDWCSCQFATSFGGLPGRHMQHLYGIEMVTDFDFLLTGVEMKWRLVTPQVADECLFNLRSMKPPSIQSIAPRAPQGMTRAERYKELNLVFAALAESSVVNDAVFD